MNPQRPLKILMLASSYPRSKEDSAGIFLRHLAENLSNRGVDVHVLAPADGRGGTSVEGNITVHRFQYFPAALQQLAYGSGILSNLKHTPWLWMQVPFFLVTMTCSLLRLAWEERPDLIHAHWVLPQGVIAVLAKFLFKIPVISTAHGSDAFAFSTGPVGKLKRLALRRSDAWTSNSQATSDAFGHDASLPKPHIIPMGVDVKLFQSGRRESVRRELPESELVILFVGRLIEEKGLDDLLKALTLLPPDLSRRTTLWVVGDGPYRARLEQTAKTLGINGKVRFWGHISNRNLPDFCAAADLLVAPSVKTLSKKAEGQGVVLLEAFAARLCVVATRVGGIAEVVENGRTGILVDPDEPQQLMGAMAGLLNNPSLRKELASNAFMKVKRHYNWENISQSFEDLYRTIMKPSSPAA